MTGGNDEKIRLDLNFPGFQAELFDLDVSEIRKIFKTFRKLSMLTWNEMFRDKGVHWEAIKSMGGKYSIRLSQSYRAVVTREDVSMRFIALHLDHDGAYGKK